MLPAQRGQLRGLPRLGKVPRRVVRVHQDDRPRLRRDRASQPFRIDLPALVVDQRRGLSRTSSSPARKSNSGYPGCTVRISSPGSHSSRKRKLYASLVLVVSTICSG